ncbi:hypothetical protein JNO63_08550 [Anaerococcus sp. mt242]|uniref:hyaluronate lyase N-terminal domain-containing protein n=1 Tax=Anaerococcus sp. mt242 TaxID=2661917 RepID=UPI00193199BC|nr:hypothetical protein [Anaerococcus sp. mt242]MBM0047124.1 hypothetical protein [Anaerococcus sp. mt242]
MATGVIQGRFTFQYGTSKEWEQSNLILLRGEPAFESDTTKLKFGDGRSLYKDLPYVSVGNLKITDFTEEQQKMIQGPPGPKGEPLTYDDLTADQRLDLKGEPGKDAEPLTIEFSAINEDGNTIVKFSDGSEIEIPKGDKGDQGNVTTYSAGNGLVLEGTTFSVSDDVAFKDDIPKKIDLTTEQKEALKTEIVPQYIGGDGIKIKDNVISQEPYLPPGKGILKLWNKYHTEEHIIGDEVEAEFRGAGSISARYEFIQLPSTVKIIRARALGGQPLEYVYIPDSVIEVEAGALSRAKLISINKSTKYDAETFKDAEVIVRS